MKTLNDNVAWYSESSGRNTSVHCTVYDNDQFQYIPFVRKPQADTNMQ